MAFSEAHALVRFFGTGRSYGEADQALVKALEGPSVDWDAAALQYADLLQPVCAVEVAAQPLGAARVEMLGDIALLHPGTGDVVLPPNARAVAIDLRGLPADPGLEQALARAIAAASTQPVARTPGVVRSHLGMTNELDSGGPIYTNTSETREPPPFAPAGTRELPVALLTGSTLAPAAARFAVDLRLAGRAWLFGESVPSAVAEYRWVPIAGRGLAVRTEALADARGLVPDLLPADRPLGNSPDALLAELPALGTPPAVDRGGAVTRPKPEARNIPLEPYVPVVTSPGVARADLVIMHGALRRFFPYFHVVGDRIDARLAETLAMVEAAPVDRERLQVVLARFGEVIQDSHGAVSVQGRTFAGFIPAILDEAAGGEVVVRRTLAPEFQPGDTVLSVGGRPMADWLTETLSGVSGATPGWRFLRAMDQLITLRGPTAFELRAADGSVRTVQVPPRKEATPAGFGRAPSIRKEGWLGDLGAPDLYYINLDTAVLGADAPFFNALTEAMSARGLVLDMRGYPGGLNHYAAARRLIGKPFTSAFFRIPTWTGSDQRSVKELQYSFEPVAPVYPGPIILLVGPGAVSAAENFSIMLVGAQRVRVVGRRSAGSNGNITGLHLPGDALFIFTGMEILMTDRSTFHGVGIVPDVEVLPTAQDFAAGRDPELLKAIELLQAAP
jgi:C-terminal processing protease CtpA/Prc